ncbi:MAG: exodeoxyribonuclease VII small subunit [Methanosarcinales archaeon]|nr:exodeoxyribonuclease VII small subunit [Methanosarcinales archaeon]
MSENGDDISFEEALMKLEEIVRTMESGDLSLDESLNLFEHGITLTKQCSFQLEHAKQKVEELAEQNSPEMDQ